MTGKENLPPGHEANANKVKKSKALGNLSQQHSRAPRGSASHLITNLRPSSGGLDNSSSKVRSPAQPAQPDKLQSQSATPVPEHDITNDLSHLRLSREERKRFQKSDTKETLRNLTQALSTDKIAKFPVKLMVPSVTQPVINQTYPLLSDDIQISSLYENNWLAHQEIAITQLINNLYDAARTSTVISDVSLIRSQLLVTYQEQSFVLLQKRLHASLLYGSLTIPKETLTKSSRLSEDLGMRQKFLNLWLHTYNLQALQICAEVVIGRECCNTPRTSLCAQIGPCSSPQKVSRQTLSQFLEIFLIRNQDIAADYSIQDAVMSGIQRTLIRSLMLIKLLDKAKISTETFFPGCLFQISSPLKSSVSVIEALAQMLHPSAGNIIRSLNHLEYSVSHIQHPLEEQNYHIENLAVDLRDGVRLTRLVELLLYPSASRLLSCMKDIDATAAIAMPAHEIHHVMQGGHDWPLSQHLKLPCLGRATKIYNVQIALSSLSGVRGIAKIVEDVKAEHIVDGFREKTVALLWGLAGKWGLSVLVDWAELKHEIRRLGGTIEEVDDHEEEEVDNDLRRHKLLLKEWAAAAAAKKGVRVNNLTTSFADGRVFEAIVDEYELYLHASKSSVCHPKKQANLSQRLADLGCSSQFGKYLPPPFPCRTPQNTTPFTHPSDT